MHHDWTHTSMRWVYRQYRRTKVYLLQRQPTWVSRLFFLLLEWFDRLLSPRRGEAVRMKHDEKWRAEYARRFGGKLYEVRAQQPVAVNSDDHRMPRGSIRDNSVHPPFNLKLESWFGAGRKFRLLDLGCAGGGLVRSFIEAGHEAVGLEGSDQSKKLGSGEWANIPLHLFTADIGAHFEIHRANNGELMRFDVITAWEVLEHLPEHLVPVLIANIARHLAPGGRFIGSVDEYPDGNLWTGAVYHLTLRPKAWWLAAFEGAGFREAAEPHFEVAEYVRGNGLGFKDWDPRDGGGFHLVLERPND